MIINTDDMPIAYFENARDLFDSIAKRLNNSFAVTPRYQIENYMGMHVLYDQQKGILTLDARRHVYGFINYMGLVPNSDVGVSTPPGPRYTRSLFESGFTTRD